MEPVTSDSIQAHIHDFLDFADSPGRFVRVARLAARAAERDTEVRENLAAIGRWATELHVGPRLTRREIRDDVAPVLYLRAQDDIRRARLSSARALNRATRRARERLETLEPDFVEHLLTETRSLVATEDVFSRRIELARSELDAARPDLLQVANELVPMLNLAVTQRAREADLAPRVRVRCSLAGVDVPCWLYVGVVVAVIIIKVV